MLKSRFTTATLQVSISELEHIKNVVHTARVRYDNGEQISLLGSTIVVYLEKREEF